MKVKKIYYKCDQCLNIVEKEDDSIRIEAIDRVYVHKSYLQLLSKKNRIDFCDKACAMKYMDRVFSKTEEDTRDID